MLHENFATWAVALSEIVVSGGLKKTGYDAFTTTEERKGRDKTFEVPQHGFTTSQPWHYEASLARLLIPNILFPSLVLQ